MSFFNIISFKLVLACTNTAKTDFMGNVSLWMIPCSNNSSGEGNSHDEDSHPTTPHHRMSELRLQISAESLPLVNVSP